MNQCDCQGPRERVKAPGWGRGRVGKEAGRVGKKLTDGRTAGLKSYSTRPRRVPSSRRPAPFLSRPRGRGVVDLVN